MDAISRNTASVAQDFHKAGGVQELKIPANHQLLFNNKLPSQWTTKEAAALLHSLSNNSNFANYQQQLQLQQQQQRMKYQHHNGNSNNTHKRQRQHSTGDDENTPSSASSTASSSDGGASPLKAGGVRQYMSSSATTTNGSNSSYSNSEQRKAMSAFLSENFDLQETTESAIEMMAAAAAAAAAVGSSNNSNSSNKRKYQPQLDNDEDQENQEQLIRSPPAYNNNKLNNTINYQQQHTRTTRTLNQRTTNAAHNHREHRLDLLHLDRDNKENNKQNAAATFLSNMEYQNLNKVSTHIQNYVKDIINKYYAETPLMYPAMPTATETPHDSQQSTEQLQQKPSSSQRKRMRSETEEYIEYLRNKEDITLTITPKVSTAQKQRHAAQAQQQRQSPTRQALLATPAVTLAPIAPIITQSKPQPQPPNAQTQTHAQLQQPPSKRRKSLSQIATLLPLLADAASQQQYLTAPLDFSKKPTHADEATCAATATPTLTAPAVTAVLPKAAQVSVIQAAPTQQQQKSQQQAVVQSVNDKRSSRKQAQPKKIRAPPEVIVAMLRDKYLNRMVDHKLSCRACAQDKRRAAAMLVFNYHTKGSLALHKHWKHRAKKQRCQHCMQAFKQRSSLIVHSRRMHAAVMQEKRSGANKVGDMLKQQQKKECSKQQRSHAQKSKKTALST